MNSDADKVYYCIPLLKQATHQKKTGETGKKSASAPSDLPWVL